MKSSGYVDLVCLLQAAVAAWGVSKCHLDDGQVYGEGQLAVVNATSSSHCCEACYDYPGCMAFTFATQEKACYLKDNIQWVAKKEGHTSGAYASKTYDTRACSSMSNLPFCDPKLTIDQRVDDLISRLKPEEKPILLTARASPKGAIPRLGVPEYDWGANCIHGVQSRCRGRCPTSFPNPNAHGAMWNRSLWKDMAAVMGKELRALWLADVGENNAYNVPHLGLDCWSPNININRDPRWGRNLETPGEDPYLNGEYGKHYTYGLQYGEDPRYLQAVVTLKHFAAYSLEDAGGAAGMPTRHSYNAVVSKADLAGTYFPAFKKAIREGGAKGVMCSYNAVNGAPSCASKFLLQATLRDAWNFTGYVTSDTGAVRDIYYHHWPNLSAAEGTAAAVKAGCDINSAGHEVQPYTDNLNDAVAKGLITEEDIDLLLKRTLKLRFELGLFDHQDPEPYLTYTVERDVATAKSIELSRLASRQSPVMLKNDMHHGAPALPLKADGGLVAVLGPHVRSQQALVGNYLGQICPERYGSFDCIETLATAMQKRSSQGSLVSEGCDLFGNSTAGFSEALSAATSENVTSVVLFVGLATAGQSSMAERESHDRQTLGLPGVQLELVKEVVKAVGSTKPVIVVLINGGALGIDWLKEAGHGDAVVEAFYPGVYGADAIAGLLFGEYSSGGKLPYSIMPAEYTQEVDFLNMSMSAGKGRTYRFYTGEPLWPFGFGLSYTQFVLKLTSSADMGSRSVAYEDNPTISVMVRNVGSMAGDEVVQVYFTPEDVSLRAPSPLPHRQLFDFERVHLPAGGTTEIKFRVQAVALALADAHGNLVSAPGRYRIDITNGNGATVNSHILLQGNEKVLEYFPGGESESDRQSVIV